MYSTIKMDHIIVNTAKKTRNQYQHSNTRQQYQHRNTGQQNEQIYTSQQY